MLGHIGSKWSGLVLVQLADGPRPYSSLDRGSRISQRMLTRTLRSLQRDGLVERAGESSYALTGTGRSLAALHLGIVGWADRHAPHIVASRSAFDAE
ncbi:winged helix-turn-helix transcriptional regulator [Actinoplanes sp. NPDC049265]|uniref:winged helix-turn-helix transcriptional regulator n=1 Tax=Actinoplanes sp. NPDC049265 TaxID=3363902 RepID=UPI003715D5BE